MAAILSQPQCVKESKQCFHDDKHIWPIQNGHHVAENIFQFISIFYQNLTEFHSQGSNYQWTIVHSDNYLAFRWLLGLKPMTIHYLNQRWTSLLTHICRIFGPQYVKSLALHSGWGMMNYLKQQCMIDDLFDFPNLWFCNLTSHDDWLFPEQSWLPLGVGIVCTKEAWNFITFSVLPSHHVNECCLVITLMAWNNTTVKSLI